MLNGEWAEDLEEALRRHIPEDRRSAWGMAELSRNPFRSCASQVGGVLYQSPPEPRGAGATGSELVQRVGDGGYWQLQQRGSTDLVGLRETLVRVDYSERGGLIHRPISPADAFVEAVPESPDEPALIEHAELRCNPQDGSPLWTWERLDTRDPMLPVHRILSADRKQDLTSVFLGGSKSGENYQYRGAGSRPYLPVVMYHAERTGRLWDHLFGLEAVLGSLTMGVLLTFWVHGLKDGSFVTIALVNGKISGLEVRNADGSVSRTNVISVEPGSFVEVAPIEPGVQPSVVPLQAGFDPLKVMEAIGLFESGLAEYAGVSPADLVRTGADPRSGASLSISREGLRSSQGRFEPQLRRGDLAVLSTSAKVLNSATGSAYPETGYSIQYPALPLSAAETEALRRDLLEKEAAGLISKVDAYRRLNPGISRDQAIAELARIAVDKALIERATRRLMDTGGFPAAPPAVDLEVGKAALLPLIAQAVTAGSITRESAVQMLITIGVSPDRAANIIP